jgi:hypothetical protein
VSRRDSAPFHSITSSAVASNMAGTGMAKANALAKCEIDSQHKIAPQSARGPYDERP